MATGRPPDRVNGRHSAGPGWQEGEEDEKRRFRPAVEDMRLFAERAWKGRLLFDRPRHRVQMRLPLDYPRINQFPEWFTTEAGRRYTVRDVAAGSLSTFTGEAMQAGVPVELRPAEEMRLLIDAQNGTDGTEAGHRGRRGDR